MNDKTLILAAAGIGAYLLILKPAMSRQVMYQRAPGQAGQPHPTVNQNGFDAKQTALYGAAGGLLNKVFSQLPGVNGIFGKATKPTTGDFARLDRRGYVEPVGPYTPTTGDFARMDRASGDDYGFEDGAAVNTSPSLAYDNFDYQGI